MRFASRKLFWVSVLLIGAFTVYAFGQAETGTITGTVEDASGAVIAGAKITATKLATQFVRTTITNSSGIYTVSNLPPGRYELTIEAAGFAKTIHQLEVTVGSRSTADAKLKVAAVGTQVEVTTEVTAVQPNTESQTISEVISFKQIADIPNLTNPYNLVFTMPNVSADPASNRGVGVAINGQRSASTDILLDGAENVDLFVAGTGQAVPQDSVQEFRLLTSNFTAEYGRASGGVVNVATRSGSNALHGSAYEYNRISALASNTYDNVATMKDAIASGICVNESDPNCPGRKGTFTRNQFGYSLGGPVKKNKLFFFQSSEWLRVRSSATENKQVLTPQFIAATNINTQNFFAGVPSTLRAGAILGPTMTAAQVATAINAASLVGAFSTWAAANPTVPVLQQVTFGVPSNSGASDPQNTLRWVGRGDWNISDKTTLYGRYAYESIDYFSGTVSSSAFAGYDTGQLTKNQNMLLSMTHVFTPTLVSQSRVTYNRLSTVQALGENPIGPTLYIKSNSPTSVEGKRLNLPGYLPESPGTGIPFGGPQNVYQIAEDVSWTHGKHQFRLGAQLMQLRDNRVFGAYETSVEDLGSNNVPRGFNNLMAGQLYQFRTAIDPQGKFPCKVDPATQTVIASDIPNCTVTLPVFQPRFSRNNYGNDIAFYAQDTWKIFPRLTVNLGLRWEYYGVQHNADPKLDSNFYFGSGATFFDQIRNGSVQIAQDSPVGGLWDKDTNNFAPRLGFAWDVFGNGKTSLRGGYGMSYERNFGNVTFNVIQNPPNYAVIALVNGTDVPANSLPVTTSNFGPMTGTGSKQLPATSLRAVNPHIKTAYAAFWSLALEHEVARNTMATLEYTASSGTHLYDIGNINRPGSGYVIMGDPSTSARILPQYGDINFRSDNGFSRYHAMIASLKTSNLHNTGISLYANYTWSHAIDNLSSTFSESGNNFNLGYTDAFLPGLDKGNADFDLRHQFKFSGTWDSPFWNKSSSAIARHVLGGWSFSPVVNVQTGRHYTIWDCANGGQVCYHWTPATSISGAGSILGPSGVNTWNYLDIASAGTAPSGIGADPTSDYKDAAGIADFATCTGLKYTGCQWPKMLGKNAFVGPKNWNFDIGISKNIKLTERVNLLFRSELYNAFNHHNYYVVNDDAGSYNDFVSVKKGGYPNGPNDDRRAIQFGLKVLF